MAQITTTIQVQPVILPPLFCQALTINLPLPTFPNLEAELLESEPSAPLVSDESADLALRFLESFSNRNIDGKPDPLVEDARRMLSQYFRERSLEAPAEVDFVVIPGCVCTPPEVDFIVTPCGTCYWAK